MYMLSVFREYKINVTCKMWFCLFMVLGHRLTGVWTGWKARALTGLSHLCFSVTRLYVLEIQNAAVDVGIRDRLRLVKVVGEYRKKRRGS